MKLTITSADERAQRVRRATGRAINEADVGAAIRADREELAIAVLALARYCDKQGTTASRGAAVVLHELSAALTEAP